MLQSLTAGLAVNWKIKEFAQPITSIAYLVNTVPKEDPYAHYGGTIEQRVVWVINLLEKTERRRMHEYETLAAQKII